MHLFHSVLSRPAGLRPHLFAVQTANCFLFVVLEVDVCCLGHVKIRLVCWLNLIDWLIDWLSVCCVLLVQRVGRRHSLTPSRPPESSPPCPERVVTANCQPAAAVVGGARRAFVETGSGAAAATTPTMATGSPSASSTHERKRRTIHVIPMNCRACWWICTTMRQDAE